MIGEEKWEERRSFSKANIITVGGIISIAVLLTISTLTLSHSVHKATDESTNALEKIYLYEIAKRIVDEIDSEIEKQITQMENSVNGLKEEYLDSEENLRRYVAIVQNVNGMESYGVVDANGKVYTKEKTFSVEKCLGSLGKGRTTPVISTTLGDDSNTIIRIAVPTREINFQNTNIVACFMAMDAEQMIPFLKYQGEKEQVLCRLFSKDGNCMISSDGKDGTDYNIFDTLETSCQFSGEYSLEQMKDDWKNLREGYVFYHAPEGSNYTYYIPVAGTDWMVSVRLRYSIIDSVISSAGRKIYRGSQIQLAVVMISMLLIFVLMLETIVESRKRKYEMKKGEELLRERARSLRLEMDAYKDGLTDLYNRRAYEEDMACHAKENKLEKELTFVSIDVNGLKLVNDSLGHEAGDELLKGAACCIKRCLGPYGKVYRIGGDEFSAMVYANSDMLRNIKDNLDGSVMQWEGNHVKKLSLSCGYASVIEFPDKGIEDLAKIADKKMYKSKALYYEKEGMDRRGQQAAYNALCQYYTTILKVDLTQDSFHIIKGGENVLGKGECGKISGWLKNLSSSGQVHRDDRERYMKYTDLAYLRNYFKGGKKTYRIWYRRRNEREYNYVIMEIIPSNEYSHAHQMVYLYVKDIQGDVYIYEK